MVKCDKTFKISLIGDSKVGKTSFVNKLRTGEFEKTTYCTMGLEVRPLYIKVFKSDEVQPIFVQLNIWDCAGDEKYRGMGDAYWIKSDAAIVMYDISKYEDVMYRKSQIITNVQHWIRDYCRINKANDGICVVGNKADICNKHVSKTIITHLGSDMEINNTKYNPFRHSLRSCPVNISTKTGENITKPILCILRYLLNDDNLTITICNTKTQKH